MAWFTCPPRVAGWAEATLAAMSASWPGLITLPAAEAVDDRRVALYLWDELTAQPNVPAVVLVGGYSGIGRPLGDDFGLENPGTCGKGGQGGAGVRFRTGRAAFPGQPGQTLGFLG